MSFINKVVLITGAASGLGEAVALKFAKLSARLTLLDKNKALLNKTADECEKISKMKVLRIEADLATDETVEDMVQRSLKEFGKIDVIINCAGILKQRSILDPDVMNIYDEMFAVNFRALVSLTTAATPALIESKGCIINISSVNAIVSLRSTVMYSVSKAAVLHFTKHAALELAPYGIRINAVLPGPMKTNLMFNANPKITQEQNDKIWEGSKQVTALKRTVIPEDCAELISFLASEKAVGITGAEFLIDAGLALLPQYSNK